jgi:hypothetical protein
MDPQNVGSTRSPTGERLKGIRHIAWREEVVGVAGSSHGAPSCGSMRPASRSQGHRPAGGARWLRGDYEDPALPDLTGRLTEVNHFTLTPGNTFVGSVTFHDFPSGLRIFERHHLTMVGDQIIVERDLISFEGCP